MLQKRLNCHTRNKAKKVIALFTTCVVLAGSTVPALAATANVGGGVWSYGTTISGVKKKAYSNYYHGSKTHKSTASVGTNSNTSGWVKAGNTSYASATGAWRTDTHVYYDYE